MKPGRPKHRSVRPCFITVELDDRVVFYKLDDKGQLEFESNRRLKIDHERVIESTPVMVSSPVVIQLAGLDSAVDLPPDLSEFEPGCGIQPADMEQWTMPSEFFGLI